MDTNRGSEKATRLMCDKENKQFDLETFLTSKQECCFEMEGCGDPLRPYPPVRQTPINVAMRDLDPSLVYDMSDYGHFGCDPALGSLTRTAPFRISTREPGHCTLLPAMIPGWVRCWHVMS